MKSEITFEYAINKLQEITERLENGEESLEASIKLYQSGMELSKYCEELLNGARQKIQTFGEQPLDREDA